MKKSIAIVLTLVLGTAVLFGGCKKQETSSMAAESAASAGKAYEAEAEVKVDLSGSSLASEASDTAGEDTSSESASVSVASDSSQA